MASVDIKKTEYWTHRFTSNIESMLFITGEGYIQVKMCRKERGRRKNNASQVIIQY